MLQVTKLLNFKSLIDMLNTLPTEQACREYLECIIWGGVPTCPHCGSQHSYTLKAKGEFKGMYKCKDCQQRYTVTVGTMFHGSHTPLRKWFMAIYIFSLHKKGISSYQLASDLELTQKTAWYLLHRIRFAFSSNLSIDSDSVVEIDETFVGGESKNKHANKKVKNERGGTISTQIPVLGILERNGEVTAKSMPDTHKETLLPEIFDTVEDGAVIMTDSFPAYKGLDKRYCHLSVNHSEGEYVRGLAHTNNIENFWSHMQRGIVGIYHHVSPKHLDRYCDEFSYRYNVRKQTVNEKFNYSLMRSKRLTYNELIAQ